MGKIRSLFKNEQGNVLILVSLSFMGLLATTGLVIDGGMLYMTKSHLQKVANAAVLSGAQELTSTTDERVKTIVDEILVAHEEPTALDELEIFLGNKVTIDLKKPVPLAFSKLFGIDSVDVKAHAAASIGVMGRAIGAAPLGINESIPLDFGKEYQLKVDSSELDSGNFGILALEGPGAKTYEENLRNGYQSELKVGDIIDTQTGNIAGKTQTVIDEKVNSCSNINERDCERILLVLVYKPYNFDSNQLKQVQITGFAYFYVTERMANNDTSIKGVFIKRADTGFEHSEALNKGAFSIRLTE